MSPLLPNTPILVTGAERTGTTWVGHMLSSSLFGWRDLAQGHFVKKPGTQATYLSEAFNIVSRCLWMQPDIPCWSFYVCVENEQAYIPALKNAFEFNYPFWRLILSLGRKEKVRNDFVEWLSFLQGKWLKQRPLLKDPGALFSALWLAQSFGAQVVITVRHPLAFVSSFKRLQWSIRVEDWLAQPLLIRGPLAPYEDEIRRVFTGFQNNQADLLDLACLYWNIAYRVAASYRTIHPEFILVRHEDLSREPVEGFRALYQQLGLDFTPGAEKRVQISSASENPGESPDHAPHRIRLDSRANLQNWKHRLTPEEIKRIRLATDETASLFYPETYWD